jgi:alkylhydroperoxidase/carboxymuconolactone decarboxylase family protein YurZ
MSDAADAESTERDAEDRAEIEAIRQALANSGTALAVAARLNAGVMEESGLDVRTLHLVRSAALAASGAAPVSWAANLELMEGDVTSDELMGTLIAIAPVIGTARYMQAVTAITES